MSQSDFKSGSSCSYYHPKYTHYGKLGRSETGTVVQYNVEVIIDQCDLTLRTKSESPAAAPYCYPNHWAIPVMIYVGGRLKEYDKIFF